MIAKITRGNRVGDIAAYLHGPGKADEHRYVRGGQRHPGGLVIASTIGAEGAIDPAEWAADLRRSQQTRPDITKPIWQASLRVAPGDRTMSNREWADAASRFMDEMGVGGHPWVAVRHGDDHVHVVVSRVNDDGTVWHGRNDRRAAQRVCTLLEKVHGLGEAPRRKTQPKRAVAAQREVWREAAKVSPEQRAQRRRVQQLTQAQWEAMSPEVQSVVRTTSPQRVPGAHVPEQPAPRQRSAPAPAARYSPPARKATRERDRGHGR